MSVRVLQCRMTHNSGVRSWSRPYVCGSVLEHCRDTSRCRHAERSLLMSRVPAARHFMTLGLDADAT